MLVKTPFACCLFGYLRQWQFPAFTATAASSAPSRVRSASSALTSTVFGCNDVIFSDPRSSLGRSAVQLLFSLPIHCSQKFNFWPSISLSVL